MTTRSTTHFKYGKETEAIVYRHSDGYPEGAGADLLRFVEEVRQLRDRRFDDPCYLAAKYVVFLAREFARGESALDFLSVGVMLQDPGDIEYRYEVICDGSPTVKAFKRVGPGEKPSWEEIDLEAALKASRS